MGAMNPYGGEGPGCSLDDPDGDVDEYGYQCTPDDEDEEVASTAAPQSEEEARETDNFQTDHSDLDDHVVPPWNIGLTEQQVSDWNAAESIMGTCRSIKGWLSAKRKGITKKTVKVPPPIIPDGVENFPCNDFLETVPGFFFGTKMQILGYHRETTSTTTRVISIFDELEAQADEDLGARADDEGLTTNQKKNRRRRTADGKRVRGKTRRWQALRGQQLQQAVVASDEATTIDFKPPKEAGLWMVDTANTNCWRTALIRLLSRTSADVSLLQEMKTAARDIPSARTAAERAKWRAHVTPALTTSSGGASGGTAIIARKGIGLIPHDEIIKDGFGHRVGAAWAGDRKSVV